MALYQRRSVLFYTQLTEGSDTEDDALSDAERNDSEQAHRILGRAAEAEVFGDREQVREPREGSPPDELQAP